MTAYEAMRQFADSWWLALLFFFLLGVVLFVYLRPGSRKQASDAADIPFKEDD